MMTTIALFGDSRFATVYLLASGNPMLEANFGKASDYDGRLAFQLDAALDALGKTATVVAYAMGNIDTTEALTANFPRWDNAASTVTPFADALALLSAGDIMCINFGTNDSAWNTGTSSVYVTPAQFRANIEEMVADCIAAGVVPVIVTSGWFDYDGGHYTYDINAEIAPYDDMLMRVAQENDLTVCDCRKTYYDTIAGGTWDLYARNDESYYDNESWGFENGSTPGTPAYFANKHEWIAGTTLKASTIAARLAECEPVFGGAGADSTGYYYDTATGGLHMATIQDLYDLLTDGTGVLNLKQVNTINPDGHAVVKKSTSTNGYGEFIQGAGTGAGQMIQGGASAAAQRLAAGATGAAALHLTAATGDGILSVGGTNKSGIVGYGYGIGHGMNLTGGVDGQSLLVGMKSREMFAASLLDMVVAEHIQPGSVGESLFVAGVAKYIDVGGTGTSFQVYNGATLVGTFAWNDTTHTMTWTAA